MNLILEKGSPGRFVEIEHDSRVKRFLVPDISELEGRLQGLIRNNPKLSLVRIGRAIVASKDEANELKDGIEGIPSTVLSNYVIDMCGDHPHIGQGPARFSEELILAIQTIQPEQVRFAVPEAQGQSSIYDFTAKAEPVESAEPVMPAAPTAPKLSLAETLRAQMATQVPAPVESLQDKLNAKIEEQKAAEAALPPKAEIEIVRTEGAAHIQLVKLAEPELVTPELVNPDIIPVIGDEKEKMVDTQAQLNQAIEDARKKRETEKGNVNFRILDPRPLGKMDMLLEKVDRIEKLLSDGLTGTVDGQELQSWFYYHVDSIGHEKTFAILASRLKK